MADLDRSLAEDAAAQVLRQIGVTSLPVDPRVIAVGKGIDVVARPLTGCSGCLIKIDDDFTICYSDRLHNEGFERFTIAHELGHYCLEGHVSQLFRTGTVHQSRSGFLDRNPLERQADFFAAALLMPESLFREQMRCSRKRGFPLVLHVAEVCRTSITATAIRCAAFADDPLAVIVSRGQSIEFTFLSEPLERLRIRRLHRGSIVPSSSLTSRFNRAAGPEPAPVHREGTNMLDVWFEDAPEVEMSEDVVGLGSYGRTLTVLFTEEAIDVNEEDGDHDDE
jgi:IrrE N-terminal-like domain